MVVYTKGDVVYTCVYFKNNKVTGKHHCVVWEVFFCIIREKEIFFVSTVI